LCLLPARLGYRPHVFEAEQRQVAVGTNIPAYRLPREILAREIRMIEGMGVTIETGKRLGKDFTLTDLQIKDMKLCSWEWVHFRVVTQLPGIEAEEWLMH